jgi:hypothetical protein
VVEAWLQLENPEEEKHPSLEAFASRIVKTMSENTCVCVCVCARARARACV